MEFQSYICFFAPIIIALVFVLFGRRLFNSFSDASAETELGRAKEHNREARVEANNIGREFEQCEKSVNIVADRQSEAKKSIEQSQYSVREAQNDNRKAREIIDECFKILEETESEK